MSDGSASIASGTVLTDRASLARMPARTYSDSTLIRSAWATCWSTSADGLRSPRSICERYGLETSANSASRRTESLARSRWVRMNAPTSGNSG